jgi:hypothetical protein
MPRGNEIQPRFLNGSQPGWLQVCGCGDFAAPKTTSQGSNNFRQGGDFFGWQTEAFLRIEASEVCSIGRIGFFLRKISVMRAGGFLVLEPNFHLWRGRVRWGGVLCFFGLTVALAMLSSCGSSTPAATPTITVSCDPTDVVVLGTSQCTATVENESSTLVNWSISPSGTGSITAGGLYTAPANVPTNNVVTVTATSQVAATLTATQDLTLEQAVAISAVICDDTSDNPATAVSSNSELDCTATASTGAIVPVYWSVANTNNPGVTTNLGTISAQGVYSAPLVPPPGQMVTITATSQSLATDTLSLKITVSFGNAVLTGPYVFSLSGRLTNSSNAFFARVGSFSAGGGTLTGIEDTNQGGTPNTVNTQRTFTGSYSIGSDGRGTMQFCEGTNPPACPLGSSAVTAYFRIVVVSPTQIAIIQFSPATANSATTTAGGEILTQDSSVFSAGNGNLSGAFSFNFAGVSTAATEESAVGDFYANGFGTINPGSTVAPLAPGEIEIDAGGPATLASTSYSISSNGRGTVTLGGLSFSFYMVSAGRAKFIEIDSPTPPSTTPDSILAGDAYKQQTSLSCGWGLNALSGSTILETSGASSGVVITDLGSFVASNGAVSAVSMDQNSGGTYTQPAGTGTDNYTMDSCGRGTLSVAGHSYVFYIISASDAVLQETTSGVIGHGFLLPSQGGPFVDSILTGSYAFRLGGTDAAGTAGNREDFLGQLTSAGTGTGLAGTLDLNDFGTTQTGVAVANGTYLPVPAGSLRGTMALSLSTSPSATTRNLVLYMVSPTQFYVLDTDPAPAGTAIGTIYNQF